MDSAGVAGGVDDQVGLVGGGVAGRVARVEPGKVDVADGDRQRGVGQVVGRVGGGDGLGDVQLVVGDQLTGSRYSTGGWAPSRAPLVNENAWAKPDADSWTATSRAPAGTDAR